MTDVAAILTQRPEPKRDQWGRYLIGGKAYNRATTWAETVGDRYNLERWQQRMVALGLVARQDLYAAIAATPGDDKNKIGKLCDQAIEAAKGSAGANLGTALHAFTERVDLGEDIRVPSPWDADVRAYQQTLAAAGVVIDRRYVERIVVNHTLGVAGTFDRLLEVPGLGLVVADVKTGGFLEWGAIAIQEALYANAEQLYDPTTDTCEPMPFVNTDVAIVIHLPVGQATCTLYTVDIKAGWEMAQTVRTVREWRRRRDLSAIYQPITAPISAVETVTDADRQTRDWLIRRLQQLQPHEGAFDQLAAAWPPGIPTFKQVGEHTSSQLRSIDQTVRQIESLYGIMPPNFDADLATADMVATAIARLKALPDDLLVWVQQAVAGEVPNLRSGRCRTADLNTLEPVLCEAESQRDARHAEIVSLLSAELDLADENMVAAVNTHLGGDIRRPTVDMVYAANNLSDRLRARTLVLLVDDTGHRIAEPTPVPT